ncbi:Cupredoxin [Gonapodya prolifera JEL478]|uniref:Cupredoxin n=1 Tax=Gonapodya prolifera (strain JEL478) TaxID=1344416 RepID=A0A139AQK6_GONPJ|nr:Cupredoxin [Gonapodya prolifera JEL478]|eukprot:KXS19008.1 Cupredoxin [Gonapodya prolifera JEL478]
MSKIAAIAAAALAFLAAVDPSTAATVAVANQGLTFVPKDVSINVGDTVSWTITGSHSVTQSTAQNGCTAAAPGFDSGVNTGFTYNNTFATAGTYYYYCVVGSHCAAGMTGSVTVLAAGGAPAASSGAAAPATSGAAAPATSGAAAPATTGAAAPASSAAATTTKAASAPAASATASAPAAKPGSAFNVVAQPVMYLAGAAAAVLALA